MIGVMKQLGVIMRDMFFNEETPKVLFNIFIFIFIQAFFFYFVSAGFVNTVIDDKVTRISDIFIKQLEDPQKYILLKQLEEKNNEIRDNVEANKLKRDKDNATYLLKWMGGPALGALVLWVLTALYWGFGSIWSYIFMGLAYVTEVGVFFIMMRRYEYIGTFKILDIINENLPSMGI